MRFPYLAVALVPLYLTAGVLAGVKEIWWNITYVEGANPDGLFERRVIGVNNTWPYDAFATHYCPNDLSNFFIQAPSN